MIQRQLMPAIEKRLGSKAIVLIGPRQVGKTTMIEQILSKYENQVLDLSGDDAQVRNLFTNINTTQLKELIGKNKFIFIDECQRIENIGLIAKMITDKIKSAQVILSASSSFEINELIEEPLTGRKWTFSLYPITYKEWEQHVGLFSATSSLENRLVYGFYPEVLSNLEDQEIILKELVDSYLFKDILLYANIKKSDYIVKLAQALAYQVGSEVNYSELAQLIGLDAKTIAYYINVLEKAFIVFKLPSYSTNQRNELKKANKIYFYDNGIRNAIIGNYQPTPNRNDLGQLWENFLISERLKQIKYSKSNAAMYFWRTTQQQEIDYIEVEAEKIKAFEFKFSPTKKAKFSSTFTGHYLSENKLINRDNFREFVM
jgi:uncharacterized protein